MGGGVAKGMPTNKSKVRSDFKEEEELNCFRVKEVEVYKGKRK